MLKRVFYLVIFLFPLFLLFSPNQVLGQGYFGCMWTGSGGQLGFCMPDVNDVHCDQNYCVNPTSCPLVVGGEPACNPAQRNCIPCADANQCTLQGQGGRTLFFWLENFEVQLRGAAPNTSYGITIIDGNDECDRPPFVTTDSQGNSNFTVSCSVKGSYQVMAIAGSDICRFSFGIGDCIGAQTGLAGNCSLFCNQSMQDGSCRQFATCCVECGFTNQVCCPSPYTPCQGLLNCNSDTNVCENPNPLGQTSVNQNLFCNEDGSPTSNNTGVINTAIGCIRIAEADAAGEFIGNINLVLNFAIPWSMGITGGIGLLLIAFAGIQIATSSGNPEKLAAGKELLTAALSGILLLVLAVFFLQFIGQRILQIPGL